MLGCFVCVCVCVCVCVYLCVYILLKRFHEGSGREGGGTGDRDGEYM